MIKFALTGTHSSGKTTLVNELSKRKEFEGFEFFTERSKFLRDTLKVPLNEESKIIPQYIFLGERARELYHLGNSLCDRSVYDVLAYTISSDAIDDEDKGAFINACLPLIKHYDCIFYVDPTGVPIENNGLRDTNIVYREQVNGIILDLLSTHRPNNLVIVRGSVEERVNIVLSELSKYL